MKIKEIIKKEHILVTFLSGLLITIFTGFLTNNPEIVIPELQHYGYPLVWRIGTIPQTQEIIITNLLINFIFWIAISLVILVILNKLRIDKIKILSFLLVLFISGLFMLIVHEMGHIIFGIIGGGELELIKIAYLELYPKIELTSNFVLGRATLTGFESDFGRGLYLLMGSMSTNILAWVLAPFKNKNIILKVSGIFGLLDLPTYTLFPQFGLKHWIVIGGSSPEPLTGARLMGIPDWTFYLFVLFSTIGLTYIYFLKGNKKNLKQKINYFLS